MEAVKKNRDFVVSRTKVASRIAKGPGSYFGEWDAYRAAQAGNFAQAIQLAEAHNAEVKRGQIPAFVLEEWRNEQKINQALALVESRGKD